MAPFSSVALCLACVCLLCLASSTASFDEVSLTARFDEELDFSIGSNFVCEFAKCLKGQCVNSSSLPFYHCKCDAGWASPFGLSWLPCVLPNCSLDFACGNTSSAAPAPPPTAPVVGGDVDVCSLSICGNGKCISNSSANNSSDGYECQCDAGYVNLRNQSDGYCIRQCALGANCASLGLPLGGTSPPPPPSVSSPSTSSSSNVNQGTSSSPPPSSEISQENKGREKAFQNRLFFVATLALALLWA